MLHGITPEATTVESFRLEKGQVLLISTDLKGQSFEQKNTKILISLILAFRNARSSYVKVFFLGQSPYQHLISLVTRECKSAELSKYHLNHPNRIFPTTLDWLQERSQIENLSGARGSVVRAIAARSETQSAKASHCCCHLSVNEPKKSESSC
ncbi:hypothetical protein CEXT_68761 [Caerostris extrusa]|uniref:Uncharacterized protein n=1 Tax=Caerostris extrusa TaxID=172846 RepID=A0AAV4XVF9_CAEEX|nr:hypothetical protein CEXT_68761 [Caerostris extrusa]